MLVRLLSLDLRLLRMMRSRGHRGWTQRLVLWLCGAAEMGALWTGIGLLAARLDPGRRDQWLRAAGASQAAGLGNYLIKLGMRRDRPHLEDLPHVGRRPRSHSLPSGHAASSMAAAVELGRVEPRLRPPLIGLAVLIGMARPWLGVHYPSDVAAGWASGYGWARLYRWGGRRWQARRAASDLAPEASESPPESEPVRLPVGGENREQEK